MKSESCEAFEKRVNELLDARLDPHADGELLAHSVDCQECELLLETQRDLFAFIAKSQSDVQRKRAVVSSRAGQWRTIATVLAACLAIGVAIVNRSPKSQTSVAEVSTPSAADEVVSVEIQPRVSTNRALVMDDALASINAFLTEYPVDTQWLEPVASPIRPLADSMTSTFNVLRQALPPIRKKGTDRVEESAQIDLALANIA
ncbi:MAG: hypothetical protein KDB27_36390 [Planctomycetales bacterium]|nr:hypothetical protein [Planctomycetales bacterium]